MFTLDYCFEEVKVNPDTKCNGCERLARSVSSWLPKSKLSLLRNTHRNHDFCRLSYGVLESGYEHAAQA